MSGYTEIIQSFNSFERTESHVWMYTTKRSNQVIDSTMGQAMESVHILVRFILQRRFQSLFPALWTSRS